MATMEGGIALASTLTLKIPETITGWDYSAVLSTGEIINAGHTSAIVIDL
jgi:hypothetical protein